MFKGIQKAQKKNGEVYFRASITYKSKHISLGSFQSKEAAASAYTQAHNILNSNTSLQEYLDNELENGVLSYDKVISLINVRQNGVYFANPIFLMKKYFYYYLSPEEIMTFDAEDLFYYANHKIQRRGGRLFVADYGMQVTLNSRYGIKPFAVINRDYMFLNGDTLDYRYENIRILSKYTGVYPQTNPSSPTSNIYKVKIHFKGNYTVGTYDNEDTAAIAYNKAADYINSLGYNRNYTLNYIDSISAREYADIYTGINLHKFEKNFLSHARKH